MQGLEHLRSATAQAAEGAAERVSPHVDQALTVVGLRKRRRRWPWVAGAAAAVGAVAGAAGVLMWRRNAQLNAIEEELLDDAYDADELDADADAGVDSKRADRVPYGENGKEQVQKIVSV